MTVAERAQALEAVGFTSRQAQFLGVAALVSGCCVRRHYEAFARVRPGKNVRDFLDGLVARHWAHRRQFRRDRAHVYHLTGKPLYAVLGDTDNRHRRGHTATALARRLMLLDAVLAMPDHQWYATERDKVALFDELRVDRHRLPRQVYGPTTAERAATPTTRYFVEKLPIAATRDSTTLTFLYLTTDPTARSFERFLNDHAALLTTLPRWSVRVVYPPPVRSRSVHRQVFDHWSRALPRRPSPEEVRWALEAHRRVEAGSHPLALDDLHRLQDVVAALEPATFAALREQAAAGKIHVSSAVATNGLSHGSFEEHVIQHRYDLFGALPALA